MNWDTNNSGQPGIWDTANEMVGQRVIITTAYGDEEAATVLAVSTRNANIKVRADDGDILIGNQWGEI